MDGKSSFKSDLHKEKQLAVLLDVLYQKQLKHYDFERITDLDLQRQGIDLIFTDRSSQKTFYVDEKAQLDYVDEDLPTFAFEINYQNKKGMEQGWLFDPTKKTDFHTLVTAIYSDEPERYTSCKITFVNRSKLLSFLRTKKLTVHRLSKYGEKTHGEHGKIVLKELHPFWEGYLYSSTKNKAEKPLNLILKLDFLMGLGIAKRLV